MKYFQQTVNFDYSWEEVSTSNWCKYGPWNEKTPHVVAVDTLSRTVDPQTGIVSIAFTCSPSPVLLKHNPLNIWHTVHSSPSQIR